MNFRSLLPRFEIAVPGQLFNRPRRCFHPHSRLWSIVGCPFYSGLLSSTLSFFVWALSLGAFFGRFFWALSGVALFTCLLLLFLSFLQGQFRGASGPERPSCPFLLSAVLGTFVLFLGLVPSFIVLSAFSQSWTRYLCLLSRGGRERRFPPYVALHFY